MGYLSATILGFVQGLTEFIPVSSSGHLIIARSFLGLSESGGLGFDAVLQLATILAVLVYFWKDLWGLLVAFIKWIIGKGTEAEKKVMILAITVGTIPAVVLGLFLESYMETIFRSTVLVAVTLIAGALVFYFAEMVSKKIETRNDLTIKKGFWVGCFQVLALIPGMSRSGMTISGGLFLGLKREMAVRFSFLLAFPIILGSGLKKFFDIYKAGELASVGPELFLASVIAFITGLGAIHFLVRFLKNHSLIPFAIYRVALAVVLFFV